MQLCVPRAFADKTNKKASQRENRGGKPQRQGEISRKNKFKCAGENHTDKALLRAGLYSPQLRIVSKFFEKGNFVVQLNDASL